MRHPPTFALVPLVLVACGEVSGPAILERGPVARVAVATPCRVLRGTVESARDGAQTLEGSLAGDATGTLEIGYGIPMPAGVTVHTAAVLRIDDASSILFGDGTAGRVPPSGGVSSSRYRYEAGGDVTGGSGSYEGLTGGWQIAGWIDAGAAGGSTLEYRLLLCGP